MTLQQYAIEHPEEYALKACEANETGKILTIKNKKLVLVEFEFSLEELKKLKKDEIDRVKIEEEYADIGYLGTQFQADADSQFKISSAILMLQAHRLKSYDWYDINNKRITLSAMELKELGFLLAFRTSALVTKARELKDALQNAKTKEEIEAIRWTTK